MTEADLGNNFFLDEDCLGKSRAASATQLLQELNEHVSGAYVAEDISQVLDSRPSFLDAFSLVIATQLPTKELNKASPVARARAFASPPPNRVRSAALAILGRWPSSARPARRSSSSSTATASWATSAWRSTSTRWSRRTRTTPSPTSAS